MRGAGKSGGGGGELIADSSTISCDCPQISYCQAIKELRDMTGLGAGRVQLLFRMIKMYHLSSMNVL